MDKAAAVRSAVLLAFIALASSPAMAGDVAAEFGLDKIDGFHDEATARANCQGDGVVWADPKTGFYYPRFVAEYGVGRSGSFSCYRQAKKAGYWGFGTADSLASKAGRVFPSTCVYMIDKNGRSFCGSAGM